MALPSGWVEKYAMKDRMGTGYIVTYEVPEAAAEAEAAALTIYSRYAALASAWAVDTLYIVGAKASEAGQDYTCAVEHTSAASLTFAQDRAAHPTYWTESGDGPFGPILRRVRVQHQARPDLAWIVCTYEPAAVPTWRRLEQTPGHGVLEGGASMLGEKMAYEPVALGGLAIEAEWKSTTHHYRYKVIHGSAYVGVPKWNYRIRVVLTSAGLAACKAIFGMSNVAACPSIGIGGSGIRTLWFHALDFVQSAYASILYQCIIHLAYHDANWDTWLQVEKEEAVAIKFDLFNNATPPVKVGTQSRVVWQSVSEGTPPGPVFENRHVIAAGDFSAINGYCT